MRSSYPSSKILASKLLTCGCLLAVLMLLAAPSLFAQAVSARLEGVVSDTGQALVPGASVVADAPLLDQTTSKLGSVSRIVRRWNFRIRTATP